MARPFYHYRVDTGSYHLSYLDDAGYRDLGKKTTKGKHKLQPGWPKDFTTLPVVKRFTAAPHVSHRDGRMPGPDLLEHLCEAFPRHVVLHYRQYKRAQLFALQVTLGLASEARRRWSAYAPGHRSFTTGSLASSSTACLRKRSA